MDRDDRLDQYRGALRTSDKLPSTDLEQRHALLTEALDAAVLAGDDDYRQLLDTEWRLLWAGEREQPDLLRGFDQAADAAQRLTGDHDPFILRRAGNASARIGDLPAARARYEHLLALDSTSAEALYNLSLTLSELGDCEAALASCHRLVAIYPDDRDAQLLRIDLLNQSGCQAEALAACAQAAAAWPADPRVLCHFAARLWSRGEFGAAAEQYEAAIAAAPDEPIPRRNLGVLLSRRGDLSAAVAHFEHALTVAPDDVATCRTLMLSVFGGDRRQLGWEVLREAAYRCPEVWTQLYLHASHRVDRDPAHDWHDLRRAACVPDDLVEAYDRLAAGPAFPASNREARDHHLASSPKSSEAMAAGVRPLTKALWRALVVLGDHADLFLGADEFGQFNVRRAAGPRVSVEQLGPTELVLHFLHLVAHGRALLQLPLYRWFLFTGHARRAFMAGEQVLAEATATER